MRFVRRLSACLAAFFFLSAFAAGYSQELFCINTQEYSALLRRNGSEVIPPLLYEDIYCVVEDAIFAVGTETDGKIFYALCDTEGNLLTESTYEMFSASYEVIIFGRNGKYGAMDHNGKILLPAGYTQLTANGSGGYLAMNTDPFDDDADEILFINDLREVLYTSVYSAEGLSAVSDGRMPFRSPATEKYGYVDGNGRVIIEPALGYGGNFAGGMARASQDQFFGVIAPTGDWLISPKYSYIEIGETVILGIQGKETCIVWDRATCRELFRMDGVSINASLVGNYPVVTSGEKVLVYAADGSLLLEKNGNATVSPGAGDQVILSDGDWGAWCASIVTADGIQMDRRDQHLLPLSDTRYASVAMDVTAYDSQTLGDIRYSCNYDSMRYGLIDTEGREILPAEYLEIRCVGDERYLLVAEDGERMIDGEGEVLWSRLKE